MNRKHHVCPETETIDQRKGADARNVKKIADYLWSHIEVIEEYLVAAELPNEYAQIVAGWKQRKSGRYILERRLKKGSVFISVEDGTVYMVKGLFSTWAEMLGKSPVLLEAVFIPFRGSIISDGLVVPYRVCFGKGAIEDFKEMYMNAKRNNTIDVHPRIQPLIEDSRGEAVTEVVYPYGRKEFFWNIRVSRPKKSNEFLLHKRCCVREPLGAWKKISGIQGNRIAGSGIASHEGTHIIAHDNNPAPVPLGIDDLNLACTQVNITTLEPPSLHWAQAAGISQPEIGTQSQRSFPGEMG